MTGPVSAGSTTITGRVSAATLEASGALASGPATVASLDAGSGTVKTTGALSVGSANITGSLAGGASTVSSLNAGPASVASLDAVQTTGAFSAGSANPIPPLVEAGRRRVAFISSADLAWTARHREDAATSPCGCAPCSAWRRPAERARRSPNISSM
jgi:hypothetical protein